MLRSFKLNKHLFVLFFFKKKTKFFSMISSSSKQKRKSPSDETSVVQAKPVKPILKHLPSNDEIVSMIKHECIECVGCPPELTNIIVGYCIGFICIIFNEEDFGQPSYIQLNPYKAIFSDTWFVAENQNDFSGGFLQCSTLMSCRDQFFKELRNMEFLMSYKKIDKNRNYETDVDPNDFRPRKITELDVYDEGGMMVTHMELIKETNRVVSNIQQEMINKQRPFNLWKMEERSLNFITVEPFDQFTSSGIPPRAKYTYAFSGGWHSCISCLVVDSWFFNRSNS